MTHEPSSLLDEAEAYCPRILPDLKMALGLHRDHTTSDRLAACRSVIETLLSELGDAKAQLERMEHGTP